ncbi:MAG: hypothetical protein AAF654_02735 [Myxococcota bacterium]
MNRNPVFGLCAGGCGSAYLVELLRANGLNGVFHEKKPDLRDEGLAYYRGDLALETAKALLRQTRWRVRIEVSNRLFSLAEPLSQAFAGARFIHLHRDGWDSVRSIWSNPRVEEIFAQDLRFQTLGEYSGGDVFPAVCRYWRNINARIADDLEGRLSVSIKFDDLIAGQLHSLENFLGLRLAVRSIDPVNIKTDLRKNRRPEFADWSPAEQQTFWVECGETMTRLGYVHA